MENCSVEELSFVLTNCVMHHILAHQQRKLKRKGFLWQLATDFAINNLLFKNGIKIPNGANFDKKYKNMYAEEIYEALKKERIEAGLDAFEESENEKNQEEQEQNKFSKVRNIEENLDQRVS